jgi:hypothetical protein
MMETDGTLFSETAGYEMASQCWALLILVAPLFGQGRKDDGK